ncbi:MAG: extracellular solute-binding protein [Chloroflexi bacterium]|nr:extracellular solute-binding protein [Chloroflexota bacterium]
MPTFKPGTVVRVLQEDWAPFQNIHRTVQAFTAETGVEVDVVLSEIPEFWELIGRSFSEDEPPFDLVGADEIMLMQYAREGTDEALDAIIARDDYDLGDLEPAVLDAVSYEGRLYGLPYTAVANVLSLYFAP